MDNRSFANLSLTLRNLMGCVTIGAINYHKPSPQSIISKGKSLSLDFFIPSLNICGKTKLLFLALFTISLIPEYLPWTPSHLLTGSVPGKKNSFIKGHPLSGSNPLRAHTLTDLTPCNWQKREMAFLCKTQT